MSWLFYFASSRVLSGAGSSHLEDRGVRQRKWENNCLFWYFPCWVLLFSLSIQIYYSVQFKNFSFSPSAFYHVWNICLPMINTSVYVLNHLDNLGKKIDGWPLPKNNSGSLGMGPGHPWFSKVPLVVLTTELSAAAAAKSLQSCPTLCDRVDGSPPGSPIPGILQARTLEWAAISFSNARKWKVKVKSLSCVWLVVTPGTAAYQTPPPMGFSRQEYWSGVPLPSPQSYLVLY